MGHAERAGYLRAMAQGLKERAANIGQVWPRESGVISKVAGPFTSGPIATFEYYAGLANSYPFEERHTPTAGGAFGLLVREPVGVAGAIIPWNGPIGLIANEIAPAPLARCTIVVKSSPEAPGKGLIVAEMAEQVGLPPDVLNVVTADREVSELLVCHPRVDKISFTGSTAAGGGSPSRAASGSRAAPRLGGKSAAVVLDDADLGRRRPLPGEECFLSGQVCSSLTRIMVTRARHDELADALAAAFSRVRG